ncbi:M15 family metallopeptidase [Dysgonomonas sp.]|uniref:M15 family metallopeptidase n=1 Tax=Dysgonomonas sp. TaxID=1891233 RepID=UPI0027BB1475|nr:M15 family metallopeptidase [Dysgonomonas sp.]
MYSFSQRSKNNLLFIHPDLVKVMNEAIKNSPIDFIITDGIRSTEEQRKLYNQGRTTPGKVVTNADGVNNKSNHQVKSDGYGYAVDLYPFYNGSAQLNDAKSLKVISDHIKSVAKELGVNVQWGGDWKFKDYPHFELVK